MREAQLISFPFRFVGKNGIPRSIGRRLGSITRDGVMLDDQRILFRDIFKVNASRRFVIISLMPFATIPLKACQHLLDEYNCLVIQLENSSTAHKVKSTIDQRCTTMVITDHWAKVPKDIRRKHFKHINCPRCDALIDYTYLVKTPLLYCKYCEAIFDYFGYIMPNTEQYKTCPECEYYGRVQDYLELSLHTVGKKRNWHRRWHRCCDTCAHRIFTRTFAKNLSLGLGAIVMLRQKIKSLRGRNPLYKELAEATLYAQDGNFVEADLRYSSIVFHNEGHPGLHKNYGLLFMQNGDMPHAMFQFKKALSVCSNYLPVLEIAERYSIFKELIPKKKEKPKEDE